MLYTGGGYNTTHDTEYLTRGEAYEHITFSKFPNLIIYNGIVGVSNLTVDSIDDFHGFVFLVMRTVGLVFKFLVVITLLTMDGVIDQQMLIENRRSAIFIIFLAATIFTPDPTLFSMPVLAIPLTLLYEISVWAVGKFGWKEKRIENN